jgi:hypothetical protein
MTGNYSDLVDELKSKDPTLSWHEIAQLTNQYSGEQARSKYRRHKKSRNAKDPQPITPDETLMVSYLDKKSKMNLDWRELIDLAATAQNINKDLDDTQRTADVRRKTDKPIGIVYTGDWHLGDQATDHVQWAHDMELILDSKELFMVDLGDDRQNARSFKQLSVVLGQALSPKQQAHLLRSIVDELTSKGKLLAKVDGNHDVEWDQRLFGEALQGYLLERMQAPRFVNKGLLKLTVGDELYTNLLFHKSRFSSFLRTTHGAYREHQLSYPADVVAGGHDHVPGFELLPSYQIARDAGMPFGGMSYLVKVGTYQDSEFGWKYFHNGGRPMNITIVFWPNEHRMQPFWSPEDAIRYIRTF